MKHQKLLFFILTLLLFVLSYRFFIYVNNLLFYPYEWEPTDGDHLNFILRLLHHKSIYIDKENGWILSIYNPLYHYFCGYLGSIFKVDNLLMFSRQISILLTFGTAGLFFLFNYDKNRQINIFLIIFFSLLILYPGADFYILEILNVAPGSFLIFLFTLTLFTIDKLFIKNSDNYFLSLILSLMTALVYLSKQQGIVILPIYVGAIFLLRTKFKNKFVHLVMLTFVYLSIVMLFEYIHNGLFLKSTIFDVSKIIVPDYSLAIDRLKTFIRNNLIFIVFSILYVRKKIKDKTVDVWCLSFILHFVLLLKILGNGGGGNNYFGTFWVTLLVLSFRYFVYINEKYKNSYLFYMMAFLIFLNTYHSIIFLNNDLDIVRSPSKQDVVTYKTHEQLVSEIYELIPKNSFILINRNVGALVQRGFEVNLEGATTFSYLWNYRTSVNTNLIIKNILMKKYELIVTGLTKYPEEIELAIKNNYKIVRKSSVNLYYGKMGEMYFYTPIGQE